MLGVLRFSWWSIRGYWERIVMLCIGLVCISLCTTLLAGFTQLSTLTATGQVSHSWRTAYDLLVRTPNAVSSTEHQLQAIDPSAPEQTYGGISLAQVDTIAHISHVEVAAPEAVVGWITLHPYIPITLTKPGAYRVTTAITETTTSVYSTAQHLFIVLPLAAYTQRAGTQALPNTTYIPLEPSGTTTIAASWQLPTLLAGIDPQAEAKMVKLHWQPHTGTSSIPLLMNIHAWTPLRATMTVEASIGSLSPTNSSWRPLLQHQLNGQTLLTLLAQELGTHTPQQFAPLQGGDVTRYARVGFVSNTATSLGVQSVGTDTNGSLTRFPLLPQKTTPWLALENGTHSFTTFDSTQLALYNTNASAPLGLYQPIAGSVSPSLSPTHGLVSWPPLLFTTIDAACQLTGTQCISAVRVRVAGLAAFGQRSERLLQQVAMDIEGHTGLHVDVITGASGRPLSMQFAPDANGTPQTLSQVWIQPYAAVTISSGVNVANLVLLVAALSVTLLTLIAAALLATNGRLADVRLLLETGWSRHFLLAEAVLEACVAALLAALPAWLISLLLKPLGLPNVPVGIVVGTLGIAVVLYVGVAMLATRTAFVVRNVTHKYTRQPWLRGSWWWMLFWRQASWRRSSTALVIIAIMGACGLVCFMLLVQSAIDGILYATLLGRQVQVSLSTTHTIAALLTCISATLTAGLTLLLIVRERLSEFSVLLSVGWTRRSVAFEIMREAMLLGLLGGLFGGTLAEICFIYLYHVWMPLLSIGYIVGSGVLGMILCTSSAVYPTLVTLWFLARRQLIEA